MLVTDFNYELPEELIAQHPLTDRAASRMLHVEIFSRQLLGLARKGDLLVLNNTRVFPARLLGRRAGARAQAVSQRNPAARDFLRGEVEALLSRQLDDSGLLWQALVHPGRKIGLGESLFFGEHNELQAEVIARGTFGERTLRFEPVADFFAIVIFHTREIPSIKHLQHFFRQLNRLDRIPFPCSGLFFHFGCFLSLLP